MMTRRHFLQRLGASAGLGAALTLGLEFGSPRGQAAADHWHMPDEHLPQERVFLAYAASPSIWKDLAEDVNRSVALLARTIARYQPVTLLCRPAQEAAPRRACGGANIDYLALPLDDIWVRDYGGCFVLNGEGEAGLVDFNFNGWGGKQQAGNDSRVAGVLSERLEVRYIASQLTGEGGGIEVDGRGTAILTESCWLNDNRNPGMDKGQVEAELKALLGLRKIVWLPGIRGRDITDAHVDFYARFVRPGVVIANLDNDPDSYDYAVTREHLEILRTATDADGRALQVHTLSPPLKPRRDYSRNNPDFAAGYINYLPINGAVIAPQFGDASADRHCGELLGRLYPGRDIVQLNIDPIAAGGGGIHCVTKHMPRA
ncbi:agmatine deiminase family protein [Pseudomonas aeruginosa]|uniref:agmatine deiminase family protein n=1 Tax=Pseudomonas aeruginosa TaxID=287 RepID=UPI0013E39477|nr:agmatine deiminase family protein [Pseudomonas aeruginosa]